MTRTIIRPGLSPEQSANSFEDVELEGMSYGNSHQANAYRELLAFRQAATLVAAVAGQVVGATEIAEWLLPDCTEVTRTAPKRIWLQVSDDPGYHNEPFPNVMSADISWCDDSVGGTQVEYVRADLVAYPPPGWQLVPELPTREMVSAGNAALAYDCCSGTADEAWPAMLAAAPKSEGGAA